MGWWGGGGGEAERRGTNGKGDGRMAAKREGGKERKGERGVRQGGGGVTGPKREKERGG